jgi:hypothetical protein
MNNGQGKLGELLGAASSYAGIFLEEFRKPLPLHDFIQEPPTYKSQT